MPLSLQDFKDLYASNPVLVFLEKKPQAYTREEIAKALKFDCEKVSSKLRYLKTKRKLVHKKPYWLARKWLKK